MLIWGRKLGMLENYVIYKFYFRDDKRGCYKIFVIRRRVLWEIHTCASLRWLDSRTPAGTQLTFYLIQALHL